MDSPAEGVSNLAQQPYCISASETVLCSLAETGFAGDSIS